MSTAGKAALVLLFVLVILSLSLNGILLWQWFSFQQQVQSLVRPSRAMLQQAIADLGTFQEATIQFNIPVNENIPIQAEVPFREALEVPIHTTIPIKQEVSTTVLVDIPEIGATVPIDITIPVDMEVPVDLSVPVSIDRTVPISTTVSLDLSVPISVKVSETGLAELVGQLRQSLVSLDQAMAGIGE